ncbi:tail tape measure protein [Sphingorhabdus sp. IMCC26285]|uniref:Tail tape measure protein n=1 Tax=Sphingorhabdus profundilacus TaxID=2509718 RepID=A0A6I4M122_9SPHN|nr:tail tape measure protein [Sphingorhabdus profundilacus]MVZ97780.1 tail tape measure protein [Sphingorhabdus profundilacus]
MDEEIERLVVAVRADTRSFASDIATMRAELDGPFADGLERAGAALERGLMGAIQRGKFGFEDLRRVALSVLSEIATAAIRSGLDSLGGGGQGGAGGLLASLGSVLGGVLGAPGRATGGPVSPGRAYRVGERGPELFVPTSSGRIETGGTTPVSTQLNLTIHVSDNGRGSAPEALQRSSRHVARALRQALARE